MIIIPNENKPLTEEELKDVIVEFKSSKELSRLEMYQDYYEQRNTELVKSVQDKNARGKTPNNFVPTPYFATVVDSMAGYMFQNVQYEPEEGSEEYADILNVILDENSQAVKDMKTGTYSLAFNRGVEWVYSAGDGADIKYSTFSPLEWILIYDTAVEPDVWCAIRLQESLDGDYDYYADVIYKDLWQRYKVKYDKHGKVTIDSRAEDIILYYDECPVIVYNSEIIGDQSPFHCVITYIQALDVITTGNANEIERLTDAILILSKVLEDEDLKHMDEIKALMDMTNDDRAEYITKDMSPEFRKYVSELLINEIHKHSHVIDWYSPDSGMSGQVSSKALRTRLFDMDMYSRRIEQVYREGIEKRLRLINSLMEKKSLPTGEVNVIFNRTVPSDFDDKIEVFKNDTLLSKKTKWEKLGIDTVEEQARIDEEREGAMQQFSIADDEEKSVDTEEEEE